MSTTAESLKTLVENTVDHHRKSVGPLMPVLHSIQNELGYIPTEAVPLLARTMNLSRAEIHGVMSFYHDFRTQPTGQHVIHLCRAEACQSMGSRDLEAHARNRLGINFGETTPDGRITLEPVYCLGNCACSPSIRIGDETHVRVTAEKFDTLIAGLESQE